MYVVEGGLGAAHVQRHGRQTVGAFAYDAAYAGHADGVGHAFSPDALFVLIIPLLVEAGKVAARVEVHHHRVVPAVARKEVQVVVVVEQQVGPGLGHGCQPGRNEQLAARKVELDFLHGLHDGQADDGRQQAADAVGPVVAGAHVHNKKRHVNPRHVAHAQRVGYGHLALLYAEACHADGGVQRAQAASGRVAAADDVDACAGVKHQLRAGAVEAALQGQQVLPAFVGKAVQQVEGVQGQAVVGSGMQWAAHTAQRGVGAVLVGRLPHLADGGRIGALRLDLPAEAFHQVGRLGVLSGAGHVAAEQDGHVQRVGRSQFILVVLQQEPGVRYG